MVSGNHWVKNAYRAVKAMDALSERGQLDKQVVITGVTKRKIFDVKHKEYFKFLPYVPTEALVALYQGASCLLYPSLNEGSGYPPVECMRFGTPVIASAFSAIPEVCGDGALYLNPYSLQEIQNRVLYLLSEPDVWQNYAERALKRYSEIRVLQESMLENVVDLILADR